MKKLLVFLMCVFVTYVSSDMTPEQKEKFFAWQNECVTQTGVSDQVVMEALGGNFPDDPKLKEHILCMGRRGGILDANDKYQNDVMKQKMMMFCDDEAKVDAMLQKCNVEFETLQETAFQMAKCLHKEKLGQ